MLNENNVEEGGTEIPICCVRVGKIIDTARDSYSRLYKDDGSYHYRKIEDNVLREKETEYFKVVDITESNIGTKKIPKDVSAGCHKKYNYSGNRRESCNEIR